MKKKNFKNYIKLRDKIANEFDYKCGYCRSPIGVTSPGNIDNYLPKSKFPDFEFQETNMIYSCDYCNRIKANKSPIDADGNQLIINPKIDKFEDHIFCDNQGTLIGKTEIGERTIGFFNLNRKPLIEDRIRQTVNVLMSDDNYKSFEAIINNEHTPFDIYNNSISYISELLNIHIEIEEVRNHHYKILYANVITALETYLGDTFINITLSQPKLTKQFVETFHDYRNVKFTYTEVIEKYNNLESDVAKTLMDILYHNIDKVKGIYKETLNVDFPEDLVSIRKAIVLRHDIVHRNGKDKGKNDQTIEKKHVEDIIFDISSLVNNIQEQVTQLSI